MNTAAWARQPLEPFRYEAAPPGAQGVEICISHCDACHSDLHLIEEDRSTNRHHRVPEERA